MEKEMGTRIKSRFSFGLRTLFVVTTLIALFVSWQVRWIKNRRTYANEHPSWMVYEPQGGKAAPNAPGLLWIWGERGVCQLKVLSPGSNTREYFALYYKQPPIEVANARELFPEAIIVVTEDDSIWAIWRPGEKWTME